MKVHTLVVNLVSFTCITIASSVERRATTISNPKTPPVTVKGNAFFAGEKRFYIRGLDYQPGILFLQVLLPDFLIDDHFIGGSSKLTDPLADPTTCKRDVDEFKKLGINTVRIYTIDNSVNHDACMKMLADEGIYLALDVNSPQYSLNRENSYKVHASYNDVRMRSILTQKLF